MGKPNWNCIVCNKAYRVCRSCETTHSYKWIACCPEHYAIRNIVLAYNDKKISKQEARKELASYDLSNYKSFRNEFVNLIDDIMSEPKPKKTIPSAKIITESKD